MAIIKMICMANSRKIGEKCVAGIEFDTGKWVRPVRPGGGALSLDHVRYQDGSYPRVLDIIRVPVVCKEPLYYQPENWIADEDIYWSKLGVFKKESLLRYCSQMGYLFFDGSDCIHKDKCKYIDVPYSLSLVKPKKVSFRKTISARGRPQIRALFSYNNYRYDLVVTDPEWERRYAGAENGDYPFRADCLFTVSLGEEFEGNHYKLVAAVIEL